MLKKRGGSVIITSSVNGTRMFSNTGATAYACTKAAQVAELVHFLASDASRHRYLDRRRAIALARVTRPVGAPGGRGGTFGKRGVFAGISGCSGIVSRGVSGPGARSAFGKRGGIAGFAQNN